MASNGNWALPPGAAGNQQPQQQQQPQMAAYQQQQQQLGYVQNQPGMMYNQAQQPQQQMTHVPPPQQQQQQAAYAYAQQGQQTAMVPSIQAQQPRSVVTPPPSGGLVMNAPNAAVSQYQQQQYQQPQMQAPARGQSRSPVPPAVGAAAAVPAGNPFASQTPTPQAPGSQPTARSTTPPRPAVGAAVTAPNTATAATAAATPSPKKYSRIEQLEQKVLVTRTADEESEDGRIRNKEAMAKISDSWIYKQIRARVTEFTSYSQSLMFCGTWNVNAKGKDEGLEDFICADWGPNHQYAPDIIAVGFQEIVDLNAVNVAVDSKTQQRTQYWVERLLQTVNAPKMTHNDPQRNGYVLIHQQSLVGLLICVLVRMPHRNRVSHVASNFVGVGVMGMMGNKGGVAIRMQYYDTTLCFVCSHLAAHRENVAGRNADFANVLNKCNFEVGEKAVAEVIRNGSMSQWASGNSSVGIADHDVVLWLGDLNYRIDESMPTEQVLKLAEAKNLAPLLKLDQLNIERAEGRVFKGFMEGIITFPPTYKYQPGTDVHEQRPDKKLRAPAWCDRILWMAEDPTHIQQMTYKRSESPNISDHKPVLSTMKLIVKDVNKQKREAIYKELMMLLDRHENQTLPVIGLDVNALKFGKVGYQQSVTLPITVTNTGNVVAKFRFVPKLDENMLCKSWLSVQPTYGLLIPGEQSLTINVTLTIDNVTAQMLNSGREVLDDTLVLRLENGCDYYLTVDAEYARSCFGMSCDDLVLQKDPIRGVSLDPLKRAQNPQHDISPTQALCIPKEMWRLVDAIHQKGLQTPNLFATTPLNHAQSTTAIREALDTGTAFPPNLDVHCYVEALQQFCSSLSIPIISQGLFPTTEVGPETIQSLTRKFLEDLQPIPYNVVVYFISFFRECLLYKDANNLTAAHLARIALRMCAPPNPTIVLDSGSVARRAGMQLILLHLLETSSI